jgi:hypothetical protein
MTPLAAAIMRQKCLPLRKRQIVDQCGLLPLMADIHCFDCTEVSPLAREMNPEVAADKAPHLGFLPAPRTWIEENIKGTRLGYLLIDRGAFAEVFCVAMRLGGRIATLPAAIRLPMMAHGGVIGRSDCGNLAFNLHSLATKVPAGLCAEEYAQSVEGARWCLMESSARVLTCFLTLINSPKVIGRRAHKPNHALERKMATAFGLQGKFPLRAWTELKLDVTKPPEIDDGEPHEDHLTGKRALHFVRKFIRIRRGQLEYVSAHWRGDASIGIKQTRYKCVDGRQLEDA